MGRRGRKRKCFIVYDGRARGGVGTDESIGLVACGTLKEARSYATIYEDGCVYSYTVQSSELFDETWVEDF